MEKKVIQFDKPEHVCDSQRFSSFVMIYVPVQISLLFCVGLSQSNRGEKVLKRNRCEWQGNFSCIRRYCVVYLMICQLSCHSEGFLRLKDVPQKKNTSQKYQLGRIFTNLWRLFVVELQESMLAHKVLSLVHFHTCYLVTCSHSCTYGNQGSVAFVQASMTCLRNRY